IQASAEAACISRHGTSPCPMWLAPFSPWLLRPAFPAPWREKAVPPKRLPPTRRPSGIARDVISSLGSLLVRFMLPALLQDTGTAWEGGRDKHQLARSVWPGAYALDEKRDLNVVARDTVRMERFSPSPWVMRSRTIANSTMPMPPA